MAAHASIMYEKLHSEFDQTLQPFIHYNNAYAITLLAIFRHGKLSTAGDSPFSLAESAPNLDIAALCTSPRA